MSEDPVSPVSKENLANLRRTLPGLGGLGGQAVSVQQITPEEFEQRIGSARSESTTASTSHAGLFPVSASNAAGLRTTGNPGLRATGDSTESLAKPTPKHTGKQTWLLGGLLVAAVGIFAAAWFYSPHRVESPRRMDEGPQVPEVPTVKRPNVSPEFSTTPVPVVPVAQPRMGKGAGLEPVSKNAVATAPLSGITRKNETTGAHAPTVPRPMPRPVAKTIETKPTAASTPEIVPQLTREILRRHMAAAEPKWHSCPKEGSGKNLTIGIVIAPSGTVVKTEVIGPIGATDTARCVKGRIETMRFPAYQEGGPKTFYWSYQAP